MSNNDVQLSKNFRLSEFTRSDVAKKLKIENVPNDRQIKNLALLCISVLQPIRDNFGPIQITSGFRCGRLNNHPMVGGSMHSHHRCHSGFAAADFVSTNYSQEVIKSWILASFLPFEQMIDEPGWIHISTYRPRRQVMKAEKIDGEMVYTLI